MRRKTRTTRSCGRPAGAASLELVMVTAVALPLAGMLFFLAVQICRYVYRGLGATLTFPFL